MKLEFVHSPPLFPDRSRDRSVRSASFPLVAILCSLTMLLVTPLICRAGGQDDETEVAAVQPPGESEHTVSAVKASHAREKRQYDLPAASGEVALDRFIEQSGQAVATPIGALREVWVQPVKGRYTALKALNRMFGGTALYATRDASTGMLLVWRRDDPEGPEWREPNHPFQSASPFWRRLFGDRASLRSAGVTR